MQEKIERRGVKETVARGKTRQETGKKNANLEKEAQ